ncbi:MAG: hypothetical protein PHG25_00160 [Candidatus Pacebacteria bacterium]|nr:hypothetical protein [Candidatus Paceibacterota bacterium]
MKKIIYIKSTAIATAVASLALVVPAFAQTPTNGTANHPLLVNKMMQVRAGTQATTTRPIVGAKMMGKIASSTEARKEARDMRQASSTANRMEKGNQRGDNMIDQRIQSLTALLGRIQAMKHVSDSDKALLSTSIQAEIAALTDLKAKIASDTSTSTLKDDVNSITKSYRIYALVEPQAQIIAAADRVLGIVDSLKIIEAKVQARLASSTTASSTSLLADFDIQISSASTQAKAAVSLVASLKPDNGSDTVAASNKLALQNARANVVSAQKSLQMAEKDIRSAIGEFSKGNKDVNSRRPAPRPGTTTPPTSTTTLQ